MAHQSNRNLATTKRSHNVHKRARMVLNTNVIHLAPKVTENFRTNLEAAASRPPAFDCITASRTKKLGSCPAPASRGLCLRRGVMPTVCFRQTHRRFQESKRGCQRPIIARSPAAGRALQPPRGPGARREPHGRSNTTLQAPAPPPPGEKRSLLSHDPTSSPGSRRGPGVRGSAMGKGRGRLALRHPLGPLSFPGSRTIESTPLGASSLNP